MLHLWNTHAERRIDFNSGWAFYPHMLALLSHCLPAFMQAALVKGCGGVT